MVDLSRCESRMYPKDQKTERKAATIPAVVRYRVTGDVAAPVMTTENARMIAATTVHTSWPQKPRLPNRLK